MRLRTGGRLLRSGLRSGSRLTSSAAPLGARLLARSATAVEAGALVVLALVMMVVGAGLLAAAPRFPVAVAGAAPGGAPGAGAGSPAFGVWPLLVVLAVTPAVLAVMLVLVRQRAAALALIAASGAAAFGRFALDLELFLHPATANRPELWAPAGIGAVLAGPAPALLMAGQLCVLAGGLCAGIEAGRWRGENGFGFGQVEPAADRVGDGVGEWRGGGRALFFGVACAVLAGAGLLGSAFGSANPLLVARSALDAPVAEAIGGFGLAAGIVLAAALACSAPDHRVVIAGLVATALAVLGVALPRVAVAALAPGLWVAPGPVLAVLGALGLAALSRWVSVRARSTAAPDAGRAPPPAVEWMVPRPVLATGFRRLAGLLCVLSGGCAVAAFAADPLRLAGDVPQPRLPTVGLLLCTGLVVAVLGWLTAANTVGPLVRPALGVVAMAMPMAAAEYITAVLGVMELPEVGAGAGWWLAVVAVLAALVGALATAVAGGFERDDVDLSALPFGGPTAPAAAAAAVLALPAFLLPLVNGAGRGVTGVFPSPFELPSWALLVASTVIVGVGLLGPRCRPVQAAVLYTSGCVLLVLRLARIPFGPRPLPAAGLAEGAWASALCLVLMLVAATIAVHAAQAGASPGSGPLSSPKPVLASTRRFWP